MIRTESLNPRILQNLNFQFPIFPPVCQLHQSASHFVCSKYAIGPSIRHMSPLPEALSERRANKKNEKTTIHYAHFLQQRPCLLRFLGLFRTFFFGDFKIALFDFTRLSDFFLNQFEMGFFKKFFSVSKI